MGDFEKKIPASACWKKKTACSTNDIEKNSCTAASKKKMLQRYFLGALQNPSKTATIQWLIYDETLFLHQDLFKAFFPWMVCHHKRLNFAFSLLGLFFGRRLQSGKGDLC